MRGSKFAGWALAFVIAAVAASAPAQQDEGPPIIQPTNPTKPKPPKPPRPAGATLQVTCDMACNWKLDGEVKAPIDDGKLRKVPVSLGQHLVDATTEDGLDKVEKAIEVLRSQMK